MAESLPYPPSERTKGILAAVKRAQEDVARKAEQFGHPIATMRDGKVVKVTPHEFRVMCGVVT